MQDLQSQGIDFTGRLYLDDRAGLVLPLHKFLDGSNEEGLGKNKIGTTGKGIGPAYSDQTARCGLRVGDLRYPEWVKERLVSMYRHHNYDLAPEDIEEEIV